ncbi:MAG TPA: hypothetical protein VFN34_11900 [Ornithinibacter sp.]|nr:hypothetical protein [Ornithinibacter sp.]
MDLKVWTRSVPERDTRASACRAWRAKGGTSMGAIKSVLQWMRAKIRSLGAFAGGEDLTDAQSHRGDNYERKSNPGGAAGL